MKTKTRRLLSAVFFASMPIAFYACGDAPDAGVGSVETHPSIDGHFAPNPDFERALDKNAIYEGEPENLAVSGAVIQ